MRLTCPNCGAQYEVPDDIIPTGGRDVQCSNCGNTWFQVHADMQADIDDELPEAESAEEDAPQEASAEPAEEETFEEVEPPELTIQDDDEPLSDFIEDDEDENSDDIDLGGADWDLEQDEEWNAESDTTDDDNAGNESDVSTPQADIDEFVEDTPVEEPETNEFEKEEPDQDENVEEPVSGVRQRGLDDSVKDILKEEAELETRARAAEEPQSLETQGDLGLEQTDARRQKEPERRANEAQARMRKLRGEDDTKAAVAAVAATMQGAKETRRDLLPDIEEINSTLRTSSDGQRNPDLGQKKDVSAARGRGFRLGFSFVLLLAIGAVFVYSSHDSLSASYPQAAPFIEGFMTSANGARIWLDDQVTTLFLKLNDLTG